MVTMIVADGMPCGNYFDIMEGRLCGNYDRGG